MISWVDNERMIFGDKGARVSTYLSFRTLLHRFAIYTYARRCMRSSVN